MANDTIGSKLNALRERSGLSLSRVAKAGRYRGPSSIQRYFSDEYDPEYLPRELADRLKEALVGFGDPAITDIDIERLTEYGFMMDRAEQFRLPPSALRRAPRTWIDCNASYPFLADFADVEMFRVAEDPLRYFVRPEHLTLRPIDAFFVSAAGMMPRYNPGEIVFVERERPAAIGQDVLVNIAMDGEDGEYGILATLLARGREQITISVLNPYAEITIPIDRVDAVSPILQAADLLTPHHTHST